MGSPALLDSTLQYIARGWFILPLTWPVFPDGRVGIMGRCSCGNPKCPSPAKHPLIAKGANAASNDHAMVEAWWASWPDANIGIATGPSGLVVLDVDGALGRAQLVRDIGILSETLVAKTGREDGYHLYYTGKIASSQVKGEHLDIRGSSGYVVAPPSRHINGNTYTWINNLMVAGVPEALVRWNTNRRSGGLRRARPTASLPRKESAQTEAGEGMTRPSPTHHPTGGPYEPRDGRTIAEGSPVQATISDSSINSERASQSDSTNKGERAKVWDSNGTTERLRPGESLFRASLPAYSVYERNKLCSALAVIPADLDGQTWASYGVALFDLNWVIEETHLSGGVRCVDVGFEIWDSWSRTSKGEGAGHGEYKGREDLEKRWSRFKPNFKGIPVTIASIYEHAKSLGWKGYQSVNQYENVNPFNINGSDEGINALPLGFSGNDGESEENPLIRLNREHAVINNLGAKCLVLSWVKSPVKGVGLIPSFQTFKTFTERYCNQYITVNKRKVYKDGTVKVEEEPKELGRTWLSWTGRRTFEGIDLAPDGNLPEDYFNLWTGWALEPKQGTWGKLRDHVTEIIAGGNTDNALYVFKWLAWAVQHPGEPAGVALVLRGGKGTGKGTFGTAARMLFGSHGLHIHNAKHLTGAFNGILRNCLLLFADEAFWAGDKAGESVLKGLLTDPMLVIEHKGIDPIPCTNRLHVIMSANADWVVPVSHDDRRYAVLDVLDKRVGDVAYFNALYHEMRHGGLNAMLWDLLHVELDGWHPSHNIPNTQGLKDQKELSLSWQEEWWVELLQIGALPRKQGQLWVNKDAPKNVATAGALHAHAKELFGHSFASRHITQTALGRFTRKMGCELQHTRNGNIWVFPPVWKLRNTWTKRMKGWEWVTEIPDWEDAFDVF